MRSIPTWVQSQKHPCLQTWGEEKGQPSTYEGEMMGVMVDGKDIVNESEWWCVSKDIHDKWRNSSQWYDLSTTVHKNTFLNHEHLFYVTHFVKIYNNNQRQQNKMNSPDMANTESKSITLSMTYTLNSVCITYRWGEVRSSVMRSEGMCLSVAGCSVTCGGRGRGAGNGEHQHY